MPIFCLWGCPVAASVVLTDCFCRSVIAFQLTPDQTVLVGLLVHVRRETMSCDAGLIPYSASFLLVMFCAANFSAAPMPPAAPTQAQITVLYDAFGKSSDMHKDWGYAALVEYGGK